MIVDEKPPLDEDLLMHFGVKGMHWGVRNSDRKRREAKDGVAYNRSTWNATKVDKEDGPIKKHYSDSEIMTARKNQARRAAKYQSAVNDSVRRGRKKDGYYQNTKRLEDAQWNWQEQRDRYVANRKTKGEKRTATLLGGPVGAYLTSDFRTLTRVSNESPVKYARDRKDRVDSARTKASLALGLTSAGLTLATLTSVSKLR